MSSKSTFVYPLLLPHIPHLSPRLSSVTIVFVVFLVKSDLGIQSSKEYVIAHWRRGDQVFMFALL